MPEAEAPPSLEAFVAARRRSLLRFAFLLTNDWGHAEDLVQTALVRVLPKWGRIAGGDPEAYVRRVMVTSFISWWRRRSWHEKPVEGVTTPEPAGLVEDGTDRLTVIRLLAGLPPRQRAVLVLRYYADLSEAATADWLGCSVGTVKSTTARALARLRVDPGLAAAWPKQEDGYERT